MKMKRMMKRFRVKYETRGKYERIIEADNANDAACIVARECYDRHGAAFRATLSSVETKDY